MSGHKGMKHYGTVILKEVKDMKATGSTNREITEYFNLKNKDAVKGLLKRDRKIKMNLNWGYYLTTEDDLQKDMYLRKQIKIKKLSD